jgi:shikimate kinase
VLSADNRKLLAGHGVVVYLRATAADLWARTRHDKNRPLLRTPDPLARLRELFDERDPLYRSAADIIVDTGDQSLASLAHKLEQQLLQHQAGSPEYRGAPLRAE